jgi:hypothetical protein
MLIAGALGYVHSQLDVGPSLRPDPERADLVRLGFRLIADGVSQADVLRQLNAAGLRTRDGRPLAIQTFRVMLRNPIDVGRVVVQKWRIDRAGDCDPIVEETVFRSVQRLLKAATADPRNYARDRADFALPRLLRCMRCDPICAKDAAQRLRDLFRRADLNRGGADTARADLASQARPRAARRKSDQTRGRGFAVERSRI